MKPRAQFDWGITDGVIWIIDLDKGYSVTNDIENVVDHILKQRPESDVKLIGVETPVVYRDTEETWDAWDHSVHEFISLNVKTLEEAIRMIKRIQDKGIPFNVKERNAQQIFNQINK